MQYYAIRVRKYNEFGNLDLHDVVEIKSNMLSAYNAMKKLAVKKEQELSDEIGGFKNNIKCTDFSKDNGKLGYFININDSENKSAYILTLVEVDEEYKMLNTTITIDDLKNDVIKYKYVLSCSTRVDGEIDHCYIGMYQTIEDAKMSLKNNTEIDFDMWSDKEMSKVDGDDEESKREQINVEIDLGDMSSIVTNQTCGKDDFAQYKIEEI